MEEKVWFNDPFELFKNDKILKFWPSSNQDIPSRVNASTRFILYASTIIYLMNRDSRVFIMGIVAICVLYILYRGGVISEGIPVYANGAHRGCQQPTEDNPMANVLMTDFTDRPNRPPACYYPSVQQEVKRYLDDTIPYDAGRSRSPLPEYQRKAASRQFVSQPSTTIPGDQTSFAEFCYGKKFRPLCRDDPSQCDPNFKGAQLEAFAGLESDGSMRGSSGRGASNSHTAS